MPADSSSPVAHSPPTACRAAETYLERCIGLDPQTVGSATIARAVRLRMAACGDTDEGAFFDRLARDGVERGRFIDEVVVPESWFFRDPQVFDALRLHAVRFASTPRQTPLCILCAPCAAGEEPYSVAMALLDAGLAAHRFWIDAADVSHAALARATTATYSSNAFRGDDLAFRDRWFHPTAAGARLDETVRKQVRFSWGNLLDDSFSADRQAYDVIFCRNLLIYLTPNARDRVERTIDHLLAPDGLLMLGAAETPILKGSWIPASSTTAFTLRRGARATESCPAPPPPPPMASVAFFQTCSHQPAMDEKRPNQEAVHASRSADAGTADAISPPTPDDLLREAHALANAGRHAAALEICHRHQQAAGPSAPVFFLMGMLHQKTGDLDRAESCLHKALYMDPDRDDAFLSLSLIALQRGDSSMATQYRQSAARVLARRGTP